MDKKQILKTFSELIAIQSVSTDPNRHKEILKAAEFIKKELTYLGFDIKTYEKGNYPPLIIAKYYLHDGRHQDRKTIGVYAHYDVQPEDPVDQWKTPPFRLTVKDGKIFGRGVADCKGHITQVLATVKRLTRLRQGYGGQGNNLVLIFEGEEEVGSGHFEELISQAKKEIENIDVIYLLDFGMKDKYCGRILFGLRGLVGFELTVKTAKADLHSGMFGNLAKNPVQIISELLTKIKDSKTGKILIPGFYDKIKKPTEKELIYLPSFDVNGIISGYTGEGIKTIIPAEATVKFSFRLIEEQSPDEIEIKVHDFITSQLKRVSSPQIKYSLKTLAKLMPFHTDIENQYVKKSADILKQVFGDVVFTRSGGSVGVALTLKKIFQKPIVMTGFILEDGNIHAPNENLDQELFFKGIEVLEKIFAS